jgi:hypothetical protein
MLLMQVNTIYALACFFWLSLSKPEPVSLRTMALMRSSVVPVSASSLRPVDGWGGLWRYFWGGELIAPAGMGGAVGGASVPGLGGDG